MCASLACAANAKFGFYRTGAAAAQVWPISRQLYATNDDEPCLLARVLNAFHWYYLCARVQTSNVIQFMCENAAGGLVCTWWYISARFTCEMRTRLWCIINANFACTCVRCESSWDVPLMNIYWRLLHRALEKRWCRTQALHSFVSSLAENK